MELIKKAHLKEGELNLILYAALAFGVTQNCICVGAETKKVFSARHLTHSTYQRKVKVLVTQSCLTLQPHGL